MAELTSQAEDAGALDQIVQDHNALEAIDTDSGQHVDRFAPDCGMHCDDAPPQHCWGPAAPSWRGRSSIE
jgi:hypothetical protein